MQTMSSMKHRLSKSQDLRVAFILPGLHQVTRGAEVAFESVAHYLTQMDGVKVTLFGSGQPRQGDLYSFVHVPSVKREKFEAFPKLPVLRTNYAYEELTFVTNLVRKYKPNDFDIVVSCSYPFTNWFLQSRSGKQRPAHIYVTENGDYEVQSEIREYKYFGCDGLICTNPEYFERNKGSWRSKLIPNGVDPNLFSSGKSDRSKFNLPEDVPLVLMVSALIPSKRVSEGIKAVSELKGVHLVICGDGPEREPIKELGERVMAGRFHLMKLPRTQMPDIYRAANAFLHMSVDEPSANAYIEALATGLPIITHDRLVTQWTLENTCILVDTHDKLATMNGINTALKSDSDFNIRSRIKLAKTRFLWPNIAQEYLSFSKEVLLFKDSRVRS